MNNKKALVVMIALVISLGCSPHRIFNQAIDRAARDITDHMVEQIVDTYLGEVGPAIIDEYTVGIMQLMFYQGGYYLDEFEYEEGEYTIWVNEDPDEDVTMERAFLRERDDGWQWWRLEMVEGDPNSDEYAHLIMEALFEPAEEHHYIREMFVQYPGEDTPTEVDIDEEDAERWAIRAEEWDEEERQRVLVGTEQVDVPAGTFTAEHFRSEIPDEDARVNWWQTDRQVPGSVVKTSHSDTAGDDFGDTMVLDSYGDGAVESVLGAF